MKDLKNLSSLSRLFFAILFLTFPVGASHAKTLEGVVNVNNATVAELVLLPGIGQAKALQIIELRKSRPLAALEDLKSIKGLGTKRLEALRPYVVFSGPSTARKIAKSKVSPSQTPASSTPPLAKPGGTQP
jgi:competence protein ComEA